MDSKRQPKRPRSSTPRGDGQEPSPKKKKKKKNKSKGDKESSQQSPPKTDSSQGRNSHDSNATSEGRMMAQMMSTFNSHEQSRFEAFQRSRLPPDSVEKWLSALLSNRYELDETRPLSELVLPGQASDIVMVVSSLAKTYAQRLVWEAAKLKSSEEGNSDSQPLKPEHITAAWRQRVQQGLDPGFFLQPSNNDYSFRETQSTDHNDELLAIQSLQEEYEKRVSSGDKDAAKGENESGAEKQQVAMDVSGSG